MERKNKDQIQSELQRLNNEKIKVEKELARVVTLHHKLIAKREDITKALIVKETDLKKLGFSSSA